MKSPTPALALALALSLPISEATAEFAYQPPGELVADSGTGRADYHVYVPGMRFPIENAPAFPNSQVWGHGGMNGPGGGQCHEDNYSYPWWDNYCETRSWTMPLCPGGQGHQGQDIRPSTCQDKTHWAVAAENGTITNIGTYSVFLTTADGTVHRYLHMDPPSVPFSVGDTVTRGQRLGLVSNAFGGTPTTIHLHYDIQRNVSPHGNVFVPTYLSLVTSYQDLIGQPQAPCGLLGEDGGTIDIADDCFFLLGNVGTWRTESAGHEGSLFWTYAYDGAQPDGYARWTIHVQETADYDLSVYISPQFASSTLARYVLRRGDGTQELRLDQSQADGWTSLGTFELSADETPQWLEIYDNTGEPYSDRLQIVADALRVTPVGAEEPGEEPRPDQPHPDPATEADAGDLSDAGIPGPSSQDSMQVTTSSCSATDRPGADLTFLALLTFLGVIGLRRRRTLHRH